MNRKLLVVWTFVCVVGCAVYFTAIAPRLRDRARRRDQFAARLTDDAVRAMKAYYYVCGKLSASPDEVSPYFRPSGDRMDEGMQLGYDPQDIVDMKVPGVFEAALGRAIGLESQWQASVLSFERELAAREGDLRAQLMLYVHCPPGELDSISFLEGLVGRGAAEEKVAAFVTACGDLLTAEKDAAVLEATLFGPPALTRENRLFLRVLAWNLCQVDDAARVIADSAYETLRQYHEKTKGGLVWPMGVEMVDVSPDFSPSEYGDIGFDFWLHAVERWGQANSEIAENVGEIVAAVENGEGANAATGEEAGPP